ncbi:MAG TPA: hypothetical protein VFU63_13020 [Ktedonobacterales bacterium]|nr:hypothetical protein [Ktedonobacterales bacterium]
MGWERRKGGSGQYYTRSRRVRGQVRREYIGGGAVAHLAAEADALARAARAAQRELSAERRRQEQARREATYAAILGPAETLDLICRVAMRQELDAAGYHQHDRGEWRKRRGEKKAEQAERARIGHGAEPGQRVSGTAETAPNGRGRTARPRLGRVNMDA